MTTERKLTTEDLTIDPADAHIIKMIVSRGSEMASRVGIKLRTEIAVMDISLCHKLHCPLNLWAFLLSSDADFWHDFYGVAQNWDRKNFVLLHLFKPVNRKTPS